MEWLCLFSGWCLTLPCLAEAHRGNMCTLHLLQCTFGFLQVQQETFKKSQALWKRGVWIINCLLWVSCTTLDNPGPLAFLRWHVQNIERTFCISCTVLASSATWCEGTRHEVHIKQLDMAATVVPIGCRMRCSSGISHIECFFRDQTVPESLQISACVP